MLRVLYAGSPYFSARTLELLIAGGTASGFEIVGALTNPPRSQGRHKTLIPTPVHDCALQHGIPVIAPDRLDGAAREQVAALRPDLLVCFAYGKIFGPQFLSLFRYGGVNLHPSLLPKYRGPTPVHAAIRNGDSETALTVQTLSLKMDEGNILAQKRVSLAGTETAGELLLSFAVDGVPLLCDVLVETAAHSALPVGTPQQGAASYTTLFTKESARIDWSVSARTVDALIRSCTPEPGAWTADERGGLNIIRAHIAAESTPNGTRNEAGVVIDFIKDSGILVATGDGVLCVTELQRHGKAVLSAQKFINGARNFIGTKLH
ncbi:MAG: methionyl-tRNA formyltransferase [Treponema sp.]|nr:methionyl-tRNA formyltransferase [Treponema sp.]